MALGWPCEHTRPVLMAQTKEQGLVTDQGQNGQTSGPPPENVTSGLLFLFSIKEALIELP